MDLGIFQLVAVLTGLYIVKDMLILLQILPV